MCSNVCALQLHHGPDYAVGPHFQVLGYDLCCRTLTFCVDPILWPFYSTHERSLPATSSAHVVSLSPRHTSATGELLRVPRRWHAPCSGIPLSLPVLSSRRPCARARPGSVRNSDCLHSGVDVAVAARLTGEEAIILDASLLRVSAAMNENRVA